MKKKILVTCAFPYANGSIHIGHLLEHIQADIWVRYKRMRGNIVWFLCADDTHGTAIMMQARKFKISPKKLIFDISQEHQYDFKKFNILYDHYSSTNNFENNYFVNKIYYQLKKNKLITYKNISQLYDIQEKMFLSDRFIKGTCPFCYFKNQYGDNCESCGAIYKSIELIDPISNISNTSPIIRDSLHLFFNLPMIQNQLEKWINSGIFQTQILKKIQEWFKLGLKEWDISRDSPYFGFEIPDFKNKYFYVWFDASIAYISSSKELCDKNKFLEFNHLWKKNSDIELYHFIGKDIIYFHALFWPAILESINFRKPTKIFVHGYLTAKGIKFSKSRNSIISAKKWIKYLDSDSLRYYYASKLSSKIEDIEMNLAEFVNIINSNIVNKIVNLASRSSSFLNLYFDNILSAQLEDKILYKKFVNYNDIIGEAFENREFSLVIRKIIELSDFANEYINIKKPWKILNKKNNILLQDICSMGINLFRIIMIFMKPITPDLVKESEKFLVTDLTWENIPFPLLNHRILPFKALYKRIDFNIFKNHF